MSGQQFKYVVVINDVMVSMGAHQTKHHIIKQHFKL